MLEVCKEVCMAWRISHGVSAFEAVRFILHSCCKAPNFIFVSMLAANDSNQGVSNMKRRKKGKWKIEKEKQMLEERFIVD
ncbi:hypothetical protein LWI29_024226 [Acer saccharum]|uniref:Uncharacterized protein n=1 Tax=Acer saccharum TaxID=4024 RepID=A0AA39RYV2_ACESA|nr:hypothetical protein LWI29_024226 [Acer saccharum]